MEATEWRSDHEMQELARGVMRRQAWAGRSLTLAIFLGLASGALVWFFETNGARDALLRWAYQHERWDLAVRVATGTYAGYTWRQWATWGGAGAGFLWAVWLLLSWRAETRMHVTPGLRARVKEEREAAGWGFGTVLGAILIIPLIILFFGVIVAAAAAFANDERDHHHHR